MIKPDITRLSPNINDAPMPKGVKTVIIHCTRSGNAGNPSEFDGTLNYMAELGTTSSHWVISRDGRAARVVEDNQQAWHAGDDNDNAWGIEIEQPVEDDGFTMPQMNKLVEVCRGYRDDFGVLPRHVHDSGSGGFVGHQETAQGRSWGKSDPGRWFNWDWFIQQLQTGTPLMPAGIGMHFKSGNSLDLYEASDHPGEVPDGVGIRWPDGTVTTIWTP